MTGPAPPRHDVAWYTPSGLPDEFIFVQQYGHGFVHGDRCRIDIDCGPDTAVHVTTQAATNVYRADGNFATQLVNLRAGPGAILEYLPESVVPYRGSRFFQRTSLTVHPESHRDPR